VSPAGDEKTDFCPLKLAAGKTSANHSQQFNDIGIFREFLKIGLKIGLLFLRVVLSRSENTAPITLFRGPLQL
jgi:hypothetical protein